MSNEKATATEGVSMSDNTLQNAIQTMNDLPNVSGDDSPELKRLCEQSTREVKLVGSVSASTSLEMVAYLRQLEAEARKARHSTAQWTDEFPTTEGAFYWVRCKLNHEDLDVASLLNGSLYFTYGGPTSKSRRRDFEYLGPIMPSDHDELIAEVGRLREALARTATLASLLTVRQVVNAGDTYIDAAGLNPWCINEGLATGEEQISVDFARAASVGDDLFDTRSLCK